MTYEAERIANVQITTNLLAAALNFPTGTKIVRVEDWTQRGVVTLRIEHDSLDPVPAAGIIPDVTLIASKIESSWAVSP